MEPIVKAEGDKNFNIKQKGKSASIIRTVYGVSTVIKF